MTKTKLINLYVTLHLLTWEAETLEPIESIKKLPRKKLKKEIESMRSRISNKEGYFPYVN